MKKFRILIFCTLIFLMSCTYKISVSKYSRFGNMLDEWYLTYKNDSLKFMIDFFGSHKYVPVHSKKILVPQFYKELLSNYHIKKVDFLFKYVSKLPPFNDCYGFISDDTNLKDSSKFIFNKTNDGESYFYSKGIFSIHNKLGMISGFAVNGHLIFLLHSKEIQNSFEEDSSLLVVNAIGEVVSFKSSSYLEFIHGRQNLKKVIDDNLFNQYDYINPIKNLTAVSTDSVYKYLLSDSYHQGLITRVSFLDDVNETRNYYNDYRSRIPNDSGFNKNYSDKIINEAESFVLNISKKEKMLMINESHYDYRNRLFLTLLLEGLYKNGYRNICLEDRDVNGTSDSAFPSKNDGFYISEPFMGNLVRKALQMGFNLYGFDSHSANIPEREKGQALNLFKLYKKDTANKWIVFGGYDHVNKFSFGSYKSMYQYFSKLAGFAPYSINQSYFSSMMNQSNIIENKTIGYYALLGDTSNKKIKQSDLYILNNINQNPYEQPFGKLKNSFKEYNYETHSSLKNEKYLFVYLKKEYNALNYLAIPFYIGKIKEHITKLFLPENDYLFWEY